MKNILKKYYLPLSAFLAFALLSFISNQLDETKTTDSLLLPTSKPDSILPRTNSIPKKPASVYNISAELNPERNILLVKQKIYWYNLTSYPTDRIYINLYPNAYASTETKFMHGRSFSEENRSKISFTKVSVNGAPARLYFFFPDSNYKSDSTTAYLKLGAPVSKGDSVIIEFSYELNVPLALGRWGHDKDEDQYFFAQWFPKVSVYKNSYWYCEPFHSFAEFYSEFSDYNVTLAMPDEYRAGSSGKTISSEVRKGKRYDTFIHKNVTDFAFFAYRGLYYFSEKIRSKTGRVVNIHYYLRGVNKSNFDRVSAAVRNSISYLEKNIGNYPFERLTILDVRPDMGEVGNMEYPGLFTFSSPFFLSLDTRFPEKIIIHELVHQYFYAAVSNNELKEAWLDEGITSYLTEKILVDSYGEQRSHFRLFNYFTLRGIEFLTVNGLPVIYTFTDTPLPPFSAALESYYKQPKSGSIIQPSDQLFSRETYFAVSYSKPQLLFATIENHIGEAKLFSLLSQYYTRYKFRHASSNDLIRILKTSGNPDVEQFLNLFLGTSLVCDFSVKGIERYGSSVNVFVQRNEDAVIPLSVALYTENDTLFKKIIPSERITRVSFKTNDVVTGAEIDPGRKNLFDLDFANNSYSPDWHPEGLLYISLRWYFWMQSLLIVSGGLA